MPLGGYRGAGETGSQAVKKAVENIRVLSL